MNKSERFFYFSIIVIEVILIVFLNLKLQKARSFQTNIIETNSISSSHRLYSFFGTNQGLEKNLVHFTAYSYEFYIFIVISSKCGNCENLAEEVILNHNEAIQKEGINLVFLTTDNLEEYELPREINILKLSWDDIFQFGPETPTIIAANGKGEILLKYAGYHDGIFDTIYEKVIENRYKKSKVIE